MIKSLEIHNFKSLHDFSIDFDKLTCLVGLNGSGKSTILQALGFLSSVMSGTVKEWMGKHSWEGKEIRSSIVSDSSRFSVYFCVEVEVEKGYIYWVGKYNTSNEYGRCTNESVLFSQLRGINFAETVFHSKNNRIKIKNKPIFNADRLYNGSILATFPQELLPWECQELIQEVKGLASMDLLSPRDMRRRSRTTNAEEQIGDRGELIASYLSVMPPEVLNGSFLESLKRFFPSVRKLNTKRKQGGWTELSVCESFGEKEIETVAGHCNDGMLRILAILSQLQGKKKILCFDEIENGISIDILEILLTLLEKADKQIILTTHSILVLNYLDPKDIFLVYKDARGRTKSKSLDQLPAIQKNLQFYDAGDALYASSLNEITQQATEFEMEKDKKL